MATRISGEQRTLPRRREDGVKLPEGVEKSVKKKKNGKVYTYYYWNPGRRTRREADRIKLPNAETEPAAFWREVERRQTSTPMAYLVARHSDFDGLIPSQPRIGKFSGGTRISMLLGAPA